MSFLYLDLNWQISVKYHSLVFVTFRSTVAPDLGLGLVRHQGDALPPDLAHALSQPTTRETGKLELFVFLIHYNSL